MFNPAADLKQNIRPEFLNRIDETIMFRPLTKQDVVDIVKIQLEGLKKKLAKNDITISATDAAIEYIAERGYDPQFGARPVKRVLQREVLNELSKDILAQKVRPEDEIIIDFKNGKLVFENVVPVEPVNEENK